MDSSDKRESLPPAPAPAPAPTYSHRPLLHHHHLLHQYLELSPLCPQHGGYLLHTNSHHHRHSAPANGYHHHLELSPDCPLHGHLLPRCPLHSNNQSTTAFPISPNFSSNPNLNNLNSTPPEADANSKSEAMMMQDRNEEDDEFIFVLTDEWKELFAKSEAKRRLAKKQAKKKGKN